MGKKSRKKRQRQPFSEMNAVMPTSTAVDNNTKPTAADGAANDNASARYSFLSTTATANANAGSKTTTTTTAMADKASEAGEGTGGVPSSSESVQGQIHDMRADLQRVRPDGAAGNVLFWWLWPIKFVADPVFAAAEAVAPAVDKAPLVGALACQGCRVVRWTAHGAYGALSSGDGGIHLLSSSDEDHVAATAMTTTTKAA